MADLSTEDLRRLTDLFGDLGGASDQVKQSLYRLVEANQSVYSTTQKSITAEQKLIELKKEAENREIALGNVFKSVFSAIQNTVKGFITVTSQLYNTTGAFTAVSIGMDAFFGQIKNVLKVLESIGGFLSIFRGITGAGGKTIEVLTKLADGSLDLVNAFIKFKLEGLQKQLDTFTQLSKAGISFGGSMNTMIATTKTLGINLQGFGKFISENIENLSALGRGLTLGAQASFKQAKDIGDTRPALLTMYGSFENLATGAAEYMALETKAGQLDVHNRQNITQSVTDYLIRQRQLTELTGMSADAIKKQEEARRSELAYQQAFNRADENTRKNLMLGMSQITAKFGPEAAKYAKEFFSTGGNVISKEGIIFRNMMGPVADTVEEILSSMSMNEQEFSRTTGRVITQNRDNIQSHVDAIGDSLGAIGQAGYGGDVVKFIVGIGGNLKSMNQSMASAAEIAEEMARQAEQIRNLPKTAADNTVFAANAIASLNNMQITIDGMVAADMAMLQKLQETAQSMNMKFIKGTEGLGAVIDSLASQDWPKFKTGVEGLAKAIAASYGLSGGAGGGGGGRPGPMSRSEINQATVEALQNKYAEIAQETERLQQEQRELSRQGIAPSTGAANVLYELNLELHRIRQELSSRQQSGSSPPQRADGGLAVGPTLVGEAGPEAVIPLRQGSVPVNINFDPMLAMMNKQQRLLEELAEKMGDSVDVQTRLLRATA